MDDYSLAIGNQETHSRLLWVLKNSGLSLKHLSSMLGSNRNAIQNWVYSGTVPESFRETINDIAETVERTQKSFPPTKPVTPENTREALFTVNPQTGLSVVAEFTQKLAKERMENSKNL